MSVFSFLLILFTFINLALNKFRRAFIFQLVFTIYIWCFVGVGSFLDTSIIRIDYWQISSLITLLMGLKLIFSYRRLSIKLLVFISIILVNVIYLIINPLGMNVVVGYGGNYEYVLGGMDFYKMPTFSKFTIFNAVLAISQALIAFIAFRIMKHEERLRLVELLSTPVKITFLIVIFEYFLKYNGYGFIYDSILSFFFGFTPSGMTSEVAARGDGFLLQGLNREGAHLVLSLFTGTLILFTNYIVKKKKKRHLIFPIIGVIMMLLSMSFTMIVSFCIIVFMYASYVFYNKTPKIKLTRLVPSMFVFALSCYAIFLLIAQNNYILDRVESAFEDLDFIINIYILYSQIFTELSSTMSRLVTIIESFNILALRPIMGVGLGTHFSHGTTGLTLAEIGILGFASYFFFYFYSWKDLNHKFLYFILIFSWVLLNVFISVPQNTLVLRGDTIIVSICLYLIVNSVKQKKVA